MAKPGEADWPAVHGRLTVKERQATGLPETPLTLDGNNLERRRGMRRRQFIAALGGAVAAWPSVLRAQQGDHRTRHIGVLSAFVPDDPAGDAEIVALRQGLDELGWVDGRNIKFHLRWPGGDLERVRALAKDLVELKPDVLVSRSTPATVALRHETDVIPIVFVNIAAEPVESGLVQTLARPGGNVTGFSNFESSIGGKWLQLLKEVDPRISRIGLIYNPQTAPFGRLFLRSVQSAAPLLSLRVVDLPVQTTPNIETELAAFAGERGSSLVAIPDSFTLEHRHLIIALAARYRLPAVYPWTSATRSGGLMAYAVDIPDAMRRAAGYIDRIFKGAKPGDLPVQQPAQFTLSVNLRTAKALGLEFPPSLLATADEVIE
jgi:putative tryptophan/tyrosine transport system substrate-binding protein